MRIPLSRLFTLLLLCLSNGALFAQGNNEELPAAILHKDSLFWRGYNTCDTSLFAEFFADDVEFYHDNGGVTMGLAALLESFRKNLCSGNFRLRREVVDGSAKVFPLRKDGVIYGAILSGDHLFYLTEKDQPERLEGRAKFTHLWLLRNGEWKMTRVLSYDHGPAPYANKRKETALPADVLRTYAGKYKGAQTGMIEVVVENNSLALIMGGKPFPIYAEKEGLFFAKERDLTFEFVRSGNAVSKMIVREKGNIAEELLLVK